MIFYTVYEYLLLLVLMQIAAWLRAENEWEDRTERYHTDTECVSLVAFFLYRRSLMIIT